ncbi:metallophosphoesterase [Hydrogenophaga sp.]|uniref:metallophosphoesterase n=1 Tax=Hydrogenophaga sp. TaxID=1904254 RepID=UPI0027162C6C|nr:metallophosphoesterase [Hydrogenophaga sp.]MDO8905958.1 metallophosphoesterase [Hydrogenophaga sp.]
MRIQLASDLHLEFLARAFPGQRTLLPAPDADLLVLAGDIGKGAAAIELFADWPMPVVYLAGNHEAYGHRWAEVVEQCRRASAGTSVQFLERNVAMLDGVRILGCTLWTDYCLFGAQAQEPHMNNAQARLNDHRLIRNADGSLFSPADALLEHERSRAWLIAELSTPFDGVTVVATHHAPHPGSVHPRYAGDPLNAAFASDLTELMPHAQLWLHGHVHDSFDYTVEGCRVVANPRGYGRNIGAVSRAEELLFENPSFKGSLILEV